jgi:hypothetical protein
LDGTSTATVTDDMTTVKSTLAGTWKATAQKDTTPISAGHDLASLEGFAYASDNANEVFSNPGAYYTLTGAQTHTYTEKASEGTGTPSASV